VDLIFLLTFRVARDPRFDRLPCSRKPVIFLVRCIIPDVRHIAIDGGTYADDCLVNRVTVNKCYVVATVSFSRPFVHRLIIASI
jgi:U3 small nucleolar RNA-associated protein 24